jgi:hypothetical protein
MPGDPTGPLSHADIHLDRRGAFVDRLRSSRADPAADCRCNQRGDHLLRIGLSATQNPIDAVPDLLAGAKHPCEIRIPRRRKSHAPDQEIKAAPEWNDWLTTLAREKRVAHAERSSRFCASHCSAESSATPTGP